MLEMIGAPVGFEPVAPGLGIASLGNFDFAFLGEAPPAERVEPQEPLRGSFMLLDMS